MDTSKSPEPLDYDLDYALLGRVLRGSASAADLRAFDAWIALHPGRPEFVRRLRAMWAIARDLRPHWDTESALADVKRAQRVRNRVSHATHHWQTDRSSSWKRIGAAALVASIAVATTIGVRHLSTPSQPTPQSVVSTTAGQRKLVRLPDGSSVTLGVGSELRFRPTFGQADREVELSGEAYFEVVRDPKRVFRVHTTAGSIQVIGTAFGVRDRPEELAVLVAVEKGNVELHGLRARSVDVVLGPGDLGRVGRDGRLSVAHNADVRRALGWTHGTLTFENEPLSAVLSELSRWYDRDFRLSDTALGRSRLTTTLRGDSLGEAVAVLEASLGVHATTHGRLIVLGRRAERH